MPIAEQRANLLATTLQLASNAVSELPQFIWAERPGKFRVLDIEELDINEIHDIFQLNKAGKLQYNL